MALQPRQAIVNTDFPATIQGQQNIEIRPKIDGYIEQIYVDEGAMVKKGQLLFRISAPSTSRRSEPPRPISRLRRPK